MSRSLRFYLDLSCEVREADDGWVLLRCGRAELVLVHAAAADNSPVRAMPPLRLPARDVRAVHRKLTADGVWVGPMIRLAGSVGQFETIDPDQHRLVIEQPGTNAGVLPTRASQRRQEHGDRRSIDGERVRLPPTRLNYYPS
jgi:hypothetical protein